MVADVLEVDSTNLVDSLHIEYAANPWPHVREMRRRVPADGCSFPTRILLDDSVWAELTSATLFIRHYTLIYQVGT